MNEQSAGEDGPTIERARQALIEAVPVPAKVILFGSRARDDGDDRRDFDFLVIEREIEDRFAEMARLALILSSSSKSIIETTGCQRPSSAASSSRPQSPFGVRAAETRTLTSATARGALVTRRRDLGSWRHARA
jgi:predicted nucleotidyltransferase